MHSTHSVGQAASDGSENLQAAPPPLQHGQHAGQGGNTGAVPIAAPAAAAGPAWVEEAAERARHSAETDPYADKSPLISFASAFVEEVERQAQHAQAELFKLGSPISNEEWWHARVAQPAVVEDWFHEDVGVFVAPGGTGKAARSLAWSWTLHCKATCKPRTWCCNVCRLRSVLALKR